MTVYLLELLCVPMLYGVGTPSYWRHFRILVHPRPKAHWGVTQYSAIRPERRMSDDIRPWRFRRPCGGDYARWRHDAAITQLG
jgi:hypothetical protein